MKEIWSIPSISVKGLVSLQKIQIVLRYTSSWSQVFSKVFLDKFRPNTSQSRSCTTIAHCLLAVLNASGSILLENPNRYLDHTNNIAVWLLTDLEAFTEWNCGGLNFNRHLCSAVANSIGTNKHGHAPLYQALNKVISSMNTASNWQLNVTYNCLSEINFY